MRRLKRMCRKVIIMELAKKRSSQHSLDLPMLNRLPMKSGQSQRSTAWGVIRLIRPRRDGP
jgi:hypothetical protein